MPRKAQSVAAFLKTSSPLPSHRRCATCQNEGLAADVAEYVALHRAGGTRWSLSGFWREFLVPKHGEDIPQPGSLHKHIHKCLKA